MVHLTEAGELHFTARSLWLLSVDVSLDCILHYVNEDRFVLFFCGKLHVVFLNIFDVVLSIFLLTMC